MRERSAAAAAFLSDVVFRFYRCIVSSDIERVSYQRAGEFSDRFTDRSRNARRSHQAESRRAACSRWHATRMNEATLCCGAIEPRDTQQRVKGLSLTSRQD